MSNLRAIRRHQPWTRWSLAVVMSATAACAVEPKGTDTGNAGQYEQGLSDIEPLLDRFNRVVDMPVAEQEVAAVWGKPEAQLTREIAPLGDVNVITPADIEKMTDAQLDARRAFAKTHFNFAEYGRLHPEFAVLKPEYLCSFNLEYEIGRCFEVAFVHPRKLVLIAPPTAEQLAKLDETVPPVLAAMPLGGPGPEQVRAFLQRLRSFKFPRVGQAIGRLLRGLGKPKTPTGAPRALLPAGNPQNPPRCDTVIVIQSEPQPNNGQDGAAQQPPPRTPKESLLFRVGRAVCGGPIRAKVCGLLASGTVLGLGFQISAAPASFLQWLGGLGLTAATNAFFAVVPDDVDRFFGRDPRQQLYQEQRKQYEVKLKRALDTGYDLCEGVTPADTERLKADFAGLALKPVSDVNAQVSDAVGQTNSTLASGCTLFKQCKVPTGASCTAFAEARNIFCPAEAPVECAAAAAPGQPVSDIGIGNAPLQQGGGAAPACRPETQWKFAPASFMSKPLAELSPSQVMLYHGYVNQLGDRAAQQRFDSAAEHPFWSSLLTNEQVGLAETRYNEIQAAVTPPPKLEVTLNVDPEQPLVPGQVLFTGQPRTGADVIRATQPLGGGTVHLDWKWENGTLMLDWDGENLVAKQGPPLTTADYVIVGAAVALPIVVVGAITLGPALAAIGAGASATGAAAYGGLSAAAFGALLTKGVLVPAASATAVAVYAINPEIVQVLSGAANLSEAEATLNQYLQ